MMLSRGLVMKQRSMSEAKTGEIFPSVSYRLDRQAVKEYIKFISATRPVSSSSPYVPPSMLAYYALWIAASHFGFKTKGALFTGMDLQFEGLASSGDTITVKDCRVEDVFISDGKRYVVLASTSMNEQNRVLCRSKITVVFKAT
jgi:hypothetical protein